MNQPGPQSFQLAGLPAMTASGEDAFVDPVRLLRAMLRHKWSILGLALVVSVAAALYVSSLEPIYRASASIVLETTEANVLNVEDVYTGGYRDYDYFQTQYELLRSRQLAERVAARLELHKHAFFAPGANSADDTDAADDAVASQPESSGSLLDALRPASEQSPPPQPSAEARAAKVSAAAAAFVNAGLEVVPVDYSQVAYLNFESTDPALAAAVVNAVAEEFISAELETRLSGTLQATDWLSERMAGLRLELRQSELALQDFREREGLVEVEGVTGLGGNELRQLARRLDDARKSRIEAENIRDEIQRMDTASTEELMTVPAVLRHPLLRELTTTQSAAERRVSELGKRYGVKHPRMIAARSDLDAANADLAREVAKVVSGINREYELALRNEEELQATWEARKSEVQRFNRTEFRLQELQREVETNRELYEIFFNRLKTVSETGGFEKPHARIVDRALVPTSPVKPNKKRSTLIAFGLAILFGCAVAILLDILDNTIKTPDDIEEKLNAIVLGALPRERTDKEGNFDQFWQKPQGAYAEAIRTVRTGVVLSSLDDPAGIIVVTSTVPGEGKSTVALNLAAALGQMENTLVIGADLRRPSLARKCALAPNHRGLSHFVSGGASLEDCIERVEGLGISVMPSGVIPPNPLEMISSRRFAEALETLRESFDRIVIDSAPVGAVSDALILSSYADSVIYVVKADSTSATQARKCIGSIVASNEPLTGVVLNQFDVKRANRYHYGDKYYRYGDYYQPGENT